MKILVFVKQVPDTDDVKLDPKTGNIMREGVASKMNPLDANAVEAAVQLKEKYGATVCAVCMGPPQAEDVLKKSLALGCDEAYLLSDRAFGGADTLATAYTLAMAAKKIGDYDLLLFGRHAVDGTGHGRVPGCAADHAGIQHRREGRLRILRPRSGEHGGEGAREAAGTGNGNGGDQHPALCQAHQHHEGAEEAAHGVERGRAGRRQDPDRNSGLPVEHEGGLRAAEAEREYEVLLRHAGGDRRSACRHAA